MFTEVRSLLIPQGVVEKLSPRAQLKLYQVGDLWSEYRNLATDAAQDFKYSFSGRQKRVLEEIAYMGVFLKTAAWMVESTVGIGLVAFSVRRNNPIIRALGLTGSALCLFLAAQDFKDAKNAWNILNQTRSINPH